MDTETSPQQAEGLAATTTLSPQHAPERRPDQVIKRIREITRAPQAFKVVMAGLYVAVCPLVGFSAFVVIYRTVTGLVSPWFGAWSWIVPASAEGMYLCTHAARAWLELHYRPLRPPLRVRLVLVGFSAACMAASYWLNIASAHGNVNDAISHGAVVTAFFGTIIIGQILIRHLKITADERALMAAIGDARRYAVDMVAATAGRWWWAPFSRKVPSLLKRRLRSGRLPDAVREAIAAAARDGRTGGWEDAVKVWVLGPDGLGFATAAGEARSVVLAEITRKARPGAAPGAARPRLEVQPESAPAAPGGALGGAAGSHSDGTAERAPAALPAASGPQSESTGPAPGTAPGSAARGAARLQQKPAPDRPAGPSLTLTRAQAAAETDEELTEHVVAMIDKFGIAKVSLRKVMTDLHVGDERAKRVLPVAQARCRPHLVRTGTDNSGGDDS